MTFNHKLLAYYFSYGFHKFLFCQIKIFYFHGLNKYTFIDTFCKYDSIQSTFYHKKGKKRDFVNLTTVNAWRYHWGYKIITKYFSKLIKFDYTWYIVSIHIGNDTTDFFFKNSSTLIGSIGIVRIQPEDRSWFKLTTSASLVWFKKNITHHNHQHKEGLYLNVLF